MNFSVIDAVPFLLYSVLLLRAVAVWRRLRRTMAHCEERRSCPPAMAREAERRKTNLLMALLLLVSVCTVVFMISNAYTLQEWGRTLLSLRVFQMFVVGNCAVYWLVLDLIMRDATDSD